MLEPQEIAVVKMKLFELLDHETPNFALGAAQLLVQLLQTPTAGMAEEFKAFMAEMRQTLREEREKQDKGVSDNT